MMMPLTKLERGAEAEVVEVSGNGMSTRIMEYGFFPGARLRVFANQPTIMIVGIGGARYGVDRVLAGDIYVEPINGHSSKEEPR